MLLTHITEVYSTVSEPFVIDFFCIKKPSVLKNKVPRHSHFK
jgi:hypothetical protein